MPAEPSADDSLPWLYSRIDYERAITMPYRHDDFRLDRMRSLLERLGAPDRRYPIVHIAGTKGKGSTAAMVSAILSAAGLGTGLFTSPHLERIEERIRWNGQPISTAVFADLVSRVRPAVTALDVVCQRDGYGGPTFFEITTAMALCCFAQRGAAAVVLEVGLGGRLDSTNVVTPAVSAITSISFDHTLQLGRTLTAIAGEKCGIIKPGVPVISGVTDFEARNVVRHVAAEQGSQLKELSRDFEVAYEPPSGVTLGQIVYRSKAVREKSPLAPSPENQASTSQALHRERVGVRETVSETTSTQIPIALTPALSPNEAVEVEGQLSGEGEIPVVPRRYHLGLIGRHQAANAALAITLVDELRAQGLAVLDAAYERGLATIQWPARIEVLQTAPTVILDAAHNVASIAALLETLRECFPARRRWLIFATSRDKPAAAMLRQLRTAFDEIVLTRYQHNPRAVPVEQLAELLQTPDAGTAWHRPWVNGGLGFQPKLHGQDARATMVRRGPHLRDLGFQPKTAIALSPDGQDARATMVRRGPHLRTAQIHQIATPAAAWDFVRQRAASADLICITGSFFLAAEIRPILSSGF